MAQGGGGHFPFSVTVLSGCNTKDVFRATQAKPVKPEKGYETKNHPKEVLFAFLIST